MTKKKTALCLVLAAALIALLATAFTGRTAAHAANSEFTFDLSAYDVVYVIDSDCSMEVTETITINYTGYANTGFMRDIPITSGAKVQNVGVTEVIDGAETDVDYDVYIEYSDYLTVDIGDYSRKNGEYTYILRYDYIVPEQENLLSVNPIGTGWDCEIRNATVTITVPDGLVAESTKCYIGTYGTANESEYSISGNTLYVSCDSLSAGCGVTFDLYFESGVLSSHVSFAPWVAVIIALLILGALVAVKLVFFNNPPLTPVVNFTAPNDMDPLAVGQLIDGNISDEDVTSLIYYWADKGYIKINIKDDKNPVLIRVYKNLPDSAPDYQKMMYAELFKSGESVSVSSLSQKFYPVIENVKKSSKISKKAMYSSKSLTAATLSAVIGGLVMALAPIILAMVRVSSKLFDVTYFIALVPAIVVFALTQAVYFYRHKLKKSKAILLLSAIALLGAAFIAVYALLIPSMFIETVPCVFIGIISLAIAMFSVTLIVRTKLYNEQLNGILGFRNFILYAEKDKLEAMLEEDPQLYYHILPYAQVLGVTDKWENKFKALTVEPPKWLVDPLGTYIDFVVFNSLLRASFLSMHRSMTMRPPSGGGGRPGGGFAGGFGGFAGGGFGGGGGRGR